MSSGCSFDGIHHPFTQTPLYLKLIHIFLLDYIYAGNVGATFNSYLSICPVKFIQGTCDARSCMSQILW